MSQKYNDLTYEQKEKLKAKREKREAKERKKREREERLAPRREKNIIGLIGFVIAVNCLWLSFTGWWIWLDLVALVICIFGLVNKPKNWKKFLALFGAGLAVISMLNAVRVSNTWVVDESTLNYATESSVDEEESTEDTTVDTDTVTDGEE